MTPGGATQWVAARDEDALKAQGWDS